MLDPNELRKGAIFKYRDNPVTVLDFAHSHKGRGQAKVTLKIRDLIKGTVETLTVKSGDRIDEADVARTSADFLYTDKELAHFMDTKSYEQMDIPVDRVQKKLVFLKEGSTVDALLFEGTLVDIALPTKIELSIKETEPGVKGDTASGTAYKPAILETGFKVNVPVFMNQGDVIRVNTESGEYVERVS
jgi:elongation factor P